MVNLGMLEEIKDLRTVWPHEALDFTPWLSQDDNISLLADAGQNEEGFQEAHRVTEHRRHAILPDMSSFVQSLSRELFWDVDPETVDDQANRRYVIGRVLERGELPDLRKTVAFYSMPVVVSEAQQMRALDPVTLAFAACLGNVKEDIFRCFASRR